MIVIDWANIYMYTGIQSIIARIYKSIIVCVCVRRLVSIAGIPRCTSQLNCTQPLNNYQIIMTTCTPCTCSLGCPWWQLQHYSQCVCRSNSHIHLLVGLGYRVVMWKEKERRGGRGGGKRSGGKKGREEGGEGKKERGKEGWGEMYRPTSCESCTLEVS